MEQLTKNQAVATSQEAVQNQNEPQLRDENAHNDKSVHGVLNPTYQAGLRRDAVQPDIEAERKKRDEIEAGRSEERFSRNAETDLVCRLLLEKKKRNELSEQAGGVTVADVEYVDVTETVCAFIPSHLPSITIFFFYPYGHHRDLHSFPTRRSSDLQ